jgi:ATP-dependent helicase HrpA
LTPDRLARIPKPSFDPALPVNQQRAEIRAAIEAHPVVIVCGETGSGKTTQLPKILLDMGRGARGLIGHTQPRRIAARSVAARIAEELKTELGDVVGYKVRFHDKLRPDSVIKLMTDGILLAETQSDPALRAYDSIILDEAHERSLNIDFLLGYLKRLVLGKDARRPDLKLVVTSATIDAERFSKHFDGAPVIEVSGRLYPVEVRYRPVEGDAEDTTRDEEEEALADAVDELCREGPGDVLVFLPGEREIRDAAEVLRKRHPPKPAEMREILPLFARLTAAEQDRVFKPGGARRIVLATNVAETSLTVPRIRYVVDTGFARVKRYSYRNKVEQLRVEPVSQAAAKQRAGRCGRVANGVCIRLYSEEDHQRRAPYTDPELLRSSLASVILRAKSLGLGEVADFPFIDPPAPRAIADGYALLAELGAVDDDKQLTEVGRELARLPLDPRVGRMLVAARAEGCLEQVLIIAAGLSVQDPRDRPLERAAAADERHAKFADERSDFLAFLKLWKFFDSEIDHKKSNRKLAQSCRDNFLSIARMREWRDIHAQLHTTVAELGWRDSTVDAPSASGASRVSPEGYRAIHRALLTGLLGNAGMKDEAEASYTGARGIKFWVHPGSWTKKPGRWIVAAELVETTRLYARTVATIEAQWLEELGAHLIKRHQDNPHWEKSRAQVVALERGTLYGLPVYVNRRVHYGPLDPKLAREVFIRAALVEGEFETRAPFFAHNRRLIAEIERLEHKSRRPDILVDESLIYAFYDARLPEGIHNGADFEKWRKDAEREDAKLLFLTRDELMRHEAAGITTDNFPAALQLGANRFALEYHFEPGSPRDGVTMTVPVALLNQVPAARCEWLVPGLLKEKLRALAKSMPQRLRHKLGALDEFAEAFAAAVPPSDTPLAGALQRYIRSELDVEVPSDAFRPDSAPPHLHMNFRVIDEHGRQLAMGRNLVELKRELGRETEAALREEAPVEEGERYRAWTFGDLDEVMEIQRGSGTLVGYPALVDDGEAVTLQVLDSPEKARELHRAGVRRLLAIAHRERIRDLEKALARDMALAPLKDDVVAAALDRTFLADSVPTRRADFARRVDEGRSRFVLIAQEVQRTAAAILAAQGEAQKKLAAAKNFPQACDDVKQQLARLLAPHWLARTPWERVQHLPRYLKAAALRLEKLRADPARDARAMMDLAPLATAWQREVAARAKLGTLTAEIEQYGWLLEELRVSLFAQELRTPVPVSAKRLAKLWQSIRSA